MTIKNQVYITCGSNDPILFYKSTFVYYPTNFLYGKNRIKHIKLIGMSISKEIIQAIKKEYNSHPSHSIIVTSLCYSFIFHNKEEDRSFLTRQRDLFIQNNPVTGVSTGVFDLFEGENSNVVKSYTNIFLDYLINVV